MTRTTGLLIQLAMVLANIGIWWSLENPINLLVGGMLLGALIRDRMNERLEKLQDSLLEKQKEYIRMLEVRCGLDSYLHPDRKGSDPRND